MTFETIASSSAGCAYLLECQPGDPRLMIECGLPLVRLRKAARFGLAGLAACLVSHRHQDHAASMLKVAQAGVPVYGSRDTIEWATGYLGPHRRYRVLEPGKPESAGPWTFSGFDVPHDAPGTLGFQVTCATGRLLYLTDAAYFPASFDRFRPTILAVECNHVEDAALAAAVGGDVPMRRYTHTVTGHMGLERLVATLKRSNLSSVLEIHLLHLSDRFGDAEKMKREVQAATGKPVYIAPKSGADFANSG